MKGTGLENGRNLWVQLDHPQGRPVNLGAYLGISFWARLSSTDSKLMVAMDHQGGSEFFKPSRTASHRIVGMSDQWERYVLLFQDFRIDGSKIVAFDFVPVAVTAPFDLWIDDLSLLCRGDCK